MKKKNKSTGEKNRILHPKIPYIFFIRSECSDPFVMSEQNEFQVNLFRRSMIADYRFTALTHRSINDLNIVFKCEIRYNYYLFIVVLVLL